MKRLIGSLLVAFGLSVGFLIVDVPGGSAAEPATAAAPAAPSAAALEFVRRTGLNNNFVQLLAKFGAMTRTVQSLIGKFGLEAVTEVFRAQVNQTVGKYGEEWTANLARIYGAEFTAEELDSLATRCNDSPHFARMVAFRDTAGKRMRAASNDLMEKALFEVVKGTAEHFPTLSK
ncbi:MAG TPA: hypothetical protein DIW51_04965 [Rhodospirillaceae bacterium]|nr:hypothetical protein [Rhodospirillaceae bacterium]HCS69302.1 hypothetical protein [Rhodospirillaceae bacterium]|tara:strand:- start:3800 stop:4324 length:525 start_codon:yes stop_codon:yes gene_type:complete